MLDIHWLQTFVTLARLQHFGQTATELHMTQPNVSLHLKRLEQATRVRLIERSPFRLTQAGSGCCKVPSAPSPSCSSASPISMPSTSSVRGRWPSPPAISSRACC